MGSGSVMLGQAVSAGAGLCGHSGERWGALAGIAGQNQANVGKTAAEGPKAKEESQQKERGGKRRTSRSAGLLLGAPRDGCPGPCVPRRSGHLLVGCWLPAAEPATRPVRGLLCSPSLGHICVTSPSGRQRTAERGRERRVSTEGRVQSSRSTLAQGPRGIICLSFCG